MTIIEQTKPSIDTISRRNRARPESGLTDAVPRNWHRTVAHFVGRDADIDQIMLELDGRTQNGAAVVLSISGVGGIGKTSLVREVLARRHERAIHVCADDRDTLTTASQLARVLATRLDRAIGPHSHCAQALARVRDLDGNALPDGLALQLADAIIRDVNTEHATTGRQVVLVLDGYEGFRDVAGPWLLDSLLGPRVAAISGDLRLIVSGREPLQRTEARWLADWDDVIINVELEPFTLEETEQFLKARRGGSSCSQTDVSAAHHVTGGLPVWLALWRPPAIGPAQSIDLASAEHVQAVVDRFLMWWREPAQLRWVRKAWIPRQFNREILSIVLGDEADAAFDWLTRQAAILRANRGGWHFHQVVRTALRYDAAQREPDALAAAHDRLAEYWRPRRPSEAVYHLLLGSDPRLGLAFLCETYVRALGQSHPAVLSSLVEAAHAARAESDCSADLAPMDAVLGHWAALETHDAGGEATYREQLLQSGLLEAAERATLLGAQLRADEQTSPLEVGVRQMSASDNRPWWPWRLRLSRRSSGASAAHAGERAESLVRYGDSLRMAGQAEAALAPLTQALTLEPENRTAYVTRGEALRVMGRDAEAIRDFSTAIDLAPDDAWPWALRAAAYLATEDWQHALSDAERATRLQHDNAWAYALRGFALCQVEQYPVPAAYALVRQALELDPSLSWARSALEQWDDLVAQQQTVRATRDDEF